MEFPIPQKQAELAKMRTRRSGRWLPRQPRLGARMCHWHILFHDSEGCESMEIRKKYRLVLTGILALCLAGLLALGYGEAKEQIPDAYVQTRGEKGPGTGSIFVTETRTPAVEEVSVSGGQEGSYSIQYRYLGVIPLKEVQVTVRDPMELIPGGMPVGIYMETRGVLAVGTGAVEGADGLNHEPATGIVEGGDYICSVNGKTVTEKEDLIQRVQETGEKPVLLGLEREGEERKVQVKAVEAPDGTYKLGIWVRDNTQGIGTITFLTKEGSFGALGHGIADADTGTLLEMSEGNLYDTEIVGIRRGRTGDPGQLTGLIRYRKQLLCGNLEKNTVAGIFGTCTERLKDRAGTEALQVGYRQEVELGEAWIRSGMSGEIRDYRAEIIEIYRKERDVNKGMVLRVTDPELLRTAGGIVQGMSGSPILQNGKIIGAVTHVFVQDSAKGFGIFIENMLEQLIR